MIYNVILSKNYGSRTYFKKIAVLGCQPLKNWLNNFYQEWKVEEISQICKLRVSR